MITAKCLQKKIRNHRGNIIGCGLIDTCSVVKDIKMKGGPNADNIRNISRLLSTYDIAKTLQET